MKEHIRSQISNPTELEQLYRSDKQAFKKAFAELYPEIKESPVAGFWQARLSSGKEDISWGSNRDWIFVLVVSILAGLLNKLPDILHIDKEFYYSRNAGFIVFPALTAFFAWKRKLTTLNALFIIGAWIISAIFINSLPRVEKSDTLVLSGIHLALFLWSLLGFAFVGGHLSNQEKKLDYLRYNGDLVVMTTLIVIAGGILTGMTIGLFHVIGFNIEKYVTENIVVFALPAAPILGTYLTQTNPQLVGKVSPVIAKIFSPLVLVMLVIYLVAMIVSGKDPYNDREFLMVFNGLLVGVMAIIFFSVAETGRTARSRWEVWILFLLSMVTIVVNGIASSAIIFRISAWGITPNRAAVLGSNLLILINLLMVGWQLFRVVRRQTDIGAVGTAIARYLPIYALWTIIVTFLFPLLFAFR